MSSPAQMVSVLKYLSGPPHQAALTENTGGLKNFLMILFLIKSAISQKLLNTLSI